MIFIILTVNSQEKAVRKYNFRSSRRNGNNILQKKGMITQALLYTLAFILTFIFPFTRSICSRAGNERGETVSGILALIFYPLQGFWNFVIYIRPGIKHVRKMNPEKSLYRATIQVIFDTKSVAASLARQSIRRRYRRSILRRRSIRIPPLSEEEEGGSSLLRENYDATRRGSECRLQEERQSKVGQKRVRTSLHSDCSYYDADGEELDVKDRKDHNGNQSAEKSTSYVSASSYLSEESLDDLGHESLDRNDIEGSQIQMKLKLNHRDTDNEEYYVKDRGHCGITTTRKSVERITSLLSISSYSEGLFDDLGRESLDQNVLRINGNATKRASQSGLVFQEEHQLNDDSLVSIPSDCSYCSADDEELNEKHQKGNHESTIARYFAERRKSHVSISSHLSEGSLDSLGRESLDQKGIERYKTQMKLNHRDTDNEEYDA